MVTDFMFVGDSLTFYNGGVWEEVARLAPEGALGHIETVVQGYAPLAKLLPMARATLQQLGPKEEGRRRVCVLQVRFMGLTLTPCVGFWLSDRPDFRRSAQACFWLSRLLDRLCSFSNLLSPAAFQGGPP